MVEVIQLESAIWSIADGHGTDDDRALLRTDRATSLTLLDRLIQEAEDGLASVRNLSGAERDQVVGDFVDTIRGLRATAQELRHGELRNGAARSAADRQPVEVDDDRRPPDPVALQASWSEGRIVVWAGGRGATPESNEGLATRLEVCGGPAHGWTVHAGIPLGGGVTAEALSIAVQDALGWLVAISGTRETDGLGASLLWLGRVALEGVRLSARGSIVPRLEVSARADGRSVDGRVRWVAAATDPDMIDALARAMPPTVSALSNPGGRATVHAVLDAVVEAIVRETVERHRPAGTAAASAPSPSTLPTRSLRGWTARRSTPTAN